MKVIPLEKVQYRTETDVKCFMVSKNSYFYIKETFLGVTLTDKNTPGLDISVTLVEEENRIRTNIRIINNG